MEKSDILKEIGNEFPDWAELQNALIAGDTSGTLNLLRKQDIACPTPDLSPSRAGELHGRLLKKVRQSSR
jgi:hypothetical protein